MKTMNICRHVFLWSCLAMLAACSGTPTRESAGEYLDDTFITSKVVARLAVDEQTSVAAINVETFKGIVQLSGFVSTQEEARKAEQIAAAVEGVVRVENKLTVTQGVGSLYVVERPVCRALGY